VPEGNETSDRPDELPQFQRNAGTSGANGFTVGPVSGLERRRLPRAANWTTHALREIGLGLVTAGFVVLLFVAYELVGTNLSEEHSQARLARDFNAVVARVPPAAGRPTVTTTTSTVLKGTSSVPKGAAVPKPVKAAVSLPTGPLPVTPPGGALDHLVIPAIGVDRYVVQGVSEADLQMGPGHYPGTPLPGQVGNVAIAGHRTTFGAPFFELNEVQQGDLVYLTDTSGTTWVYSVARQFVVAPTDVAVLGQTRGPELTLTTCNPAFEATSRLVVRALLVQRLERGTRVPQPLPAKVSGTKGLPARASTTTERAQSSTATTTPAPSVTTTGLAGLQAGEAGGDSPVVGPSPSTSSSDASTVGTASTAGTSPNTGTVIGGAWTWAAAIGWGALALLVWVLARIVAARRHRYDKVIVLLGGALVCLVPLWFAFGHIVDLLPANI
jgi:sortase A